MRPRVVRIVDIGMTSRFGQTSTFLQSLLAALGSGHSAAPLIVTELINTDQTSRLLEALHAPADVIHIVAHGYDEPARPTSRGDAVIHSDLNGEVSWTVAELAAGLQSIGAPVGAPCLYIDACESFSTVFRRHVRDLITSETAYVGCRGGNTWFDATTYASAFYPALLRNKGAGTPWVERALEAGEAAAQAFSTLLQRRCPFGVAELRPSRAASSAFQS